MPIPNQIKSALEKSQLKVVSGASVVKSGHSIEKVQWSDAAGRLRMGFYKPVEEAGTYPCLLAKFEVALHVRYQLSHGQVFPNDYLVFDEQSNIVDTLSEEIEGFRLLEDGPEFTVDLLVKNNVASIMVPSILMQCDDRHPQNYGYRLHADGSYEFFIIDLDMAFYRYTVHIKGGRDFNYDGLMRSISPHLFELSRYDLDNNPFVREQRVHWPTHYPYNLNPGKVYKLTTMEAFKALAADPKYHGQSLQQFVIHLVTYNAQCLKMRLFDRFGTLPLNYMSHVGARQGLSTNFPEQFSQDLEQHPFVDTMMQIFESYHQHEYREIVFYPGCVNNSVGISKISFHEFLMRSPKLLSKIYKWVEGQNRQLGDAITPMHHDLEIIKSNFHRIWRDSFSLRIRSIILNFIDIQKRSAQKALVFVDSAAEMASMLDSVYMPKEAEKGQDDQAQFQKMFCDFIEKLKKIFDVYFAVSESSPDILLAANTRCCESLKALLSKEEKIIRKQLPSTDRIYRYLTSLLHHIDFAAYLSAEQDIAKTLGALDVMALPVFRSDELAIVTGYIYRLFEWAANPKVLPVLLNSIETAMIKNTPAMANLYAARDERTEDIAKYLKRVMSQQASSDKASSGVSVGPEILAYIFGNGKVEDNALSTLLMYELFPKVLQDSYSCFHIDVEGFLANYNAKELDIIMYTTHVKSYIHSDKKYAHLLVDETHSQFIRDLYRWVDDMALEIFHRHVIDSLQGYKDAQGFFAARWGSSRAPEIQSVINDYSGKNSAILGLIFSKGGTNPASSTSAASFNYRLYHSLLERFFVEKKASRSLPIGLSKETASSLLQLPRFREQALAKSLSAVKKSKVAANVDDTEIEDGFVMVSSQ